MLVLTRHKNESIMIGEDIEVMIVDVKGDKVRLGIEAPKEISVHRKEIYEAIKRENIEAAKAGKASLSLAEKLLKKKSKGKREDKT